MKQKIIKNIIIIIIITITLSIFPNATFAMDIDSIMGDAKNFLDSSDETVITSDDMKPFSNTIYSVLVIIGTIIAVGTGIVLRNTIYVLIC